MNNQYTKSLDEIAIECKTDKCSLQHNYCEKYEKYLPFGRDQELKILEIGVANGSSLKMWKSFYPNSTVIGVDIDPACIKHQDKQNNVFVEIGSQNDGVFLTLAAEKYGPLDLIIDDGSHIQSDMIFSFHCLFDLLLKNHGVYIVEDTSSSYWAELGGAIYAPNTCVEFFKSLVDHVNFMGQKLIDSKDPVIQWNWRREDFHIQQAKNNINNQCRMNIESINFLNSTILITKR